MDVSQNKLKSTYHIIKHSQSLGIYPKEIKTGYQKDVCFKHGYCSIIHNRQDTEKP